MDERTLEWFEILGRALMFAGAAVFALAVIGAIVVGSSSSNLPVFDQFTEQNRGTAALFALLAGITSAGLLAGLGAVIRLLVAARREQE